VPDSSGCSLIILDEYKKNSIREGVNLFVYFSSIVMPYHSIIVLYSLNCGIVGGSLIVRAVVHS
jgi:hypothetical protein